MELSSQLPPSEPGGLVSSTLRALSDWLGALGALLVLALALLINSDILSRFVLNNPIKGVAEVVELTIVVIVFIQLPLTITTGGFVRASEFHHRLEKRLPRAANMMTLCFEATGAMIFALLAWALWPESVEAWNDNLYKGQPGLFTAPTWPAVFVTVIGSALSALCFFASFMVRIVRKGS